MITTKKADRQAVTGKTIFCLVKEDCLTRSSCMQADPLKNNAKTVQANCDNCGKEVYYIPSQLSIVLKVACCTDCEKAQNWQTTHSISMEKEINRAKYLLEHPELGIEVQGDTDGIKPKTACSVCGGERKFGGFNHTEECTNSPANKLKAKEAAQKLKSFCPICNGPSKGNGFSHTDECPNNAKNKMKEKLAKMREERTAKVATGEVIVCPGCGGAKRGRGFSHEEGCGAKKSV